MRFASLLVALVLLPGCSTNPITGRSQILALPAVQAVHADMSFALSSGAQRIAAPAACDHDCGSDKDLTGFAARAAAIGVTLEGAARGMAPDLFGRIEGFKVEIDDVLGMGTGSSAGGRVVLGSGLAGLEPTDTVIGFLLAREMAHVIARHAEEDSGASIVFSMLGALLPGFNVIARFVATRLGSSVLTSSWAVEQQREADEIAVALLEKIGISVQIAALELAVGIDPARPLDGEWGARYLESAQRVERIAASPPRYAVNSGRF